jgi:hypothetical protein
MTQGTLAVNADEGSRIGKDMAAWEAAEARLKEDQSMLKQMCAMIGTMKNPLVGAQMVMEQMTNVSGDRVEGLSAASNVDTDLRNQIMGGQTNFNTGGKMTPAQAKEMYDALTKLKAWLENQKALGNKSIMGSDSINNMLDAIKGVATEFGKSWGDPAKMVATMKAWEKQATDGKNSPDLKNIQDQFQTMNQTVSAFATTTNTQLQFQTEQYKQFLGIFNDVNSTYLKFVGTMVRNQKTS